jgi:hypothetical protein
MHFKELSEPGGGGRIRGPGFTFSDCNYGFFAIDSLLSELELALRDTLLPLSDETLLIFHHVFELLSTVLFACLTPAHCTSNPMNSLGNHVSAASDAPASILSSPSPQTTSKKVMLSNLSSPTGLLKSILISDTCYLHEDRDRKDEDIRVSHCRVFPLHLASH